jgi:hypothetical protein
VRIEAIRAGAEPTTEKRAAGGESETPAAPELTEAETLGPATPTPTE